jgi:hypothetical protein
LGSFSTTFKAIYVDSGKNIDKETVELNRRELIGIYKTFFHYAECILFSSAHGKFRIDYIIGHIISLNNFLKIQTMLCLSSECNMIKLE